MGKIQQRSNEEIFSKLEVIEIKLEEIEGAVITMLRNKQSNRLNKVEDEVKRRGRMLTKQIMCFVDVSKPTAIGYMEKLGVKLGFSYIKGSSTKRISSAIIYNKSKVFEDHLERLKGMFVSTEIITFNEIMKHFGLSLNETRDFAYAAIQYTKNYKIENENKLRRIKN